MSDVIPRLAVPQASGVTLDSVEYFLVNPLEHAFHRETLQQFDISDDRLLITSDVEHVSANEVLVPVYGSNSLGLAQASWNPQFMQRHFGPAELPAATRKLYVSRGTSGARGVANEPKIIDYLLKIGFDVVHCEHMSVSDQAELFTAASVVLGPHGAGFTNTMFCQPGTTVVEFYGAHIKPCFW